MTPSLPASPTTSDGNKVGITLAVIQLFFTLTWTVYVIFLPQLVAQVGLAKDKVLVILMMGMRKMTSSGDD